MDVLLFSRVTGKIKTLIVMLTGGARYMFVVNDDYAHEPMSNNDTMGIGGSPFLQVVHSIATISDATRKLANLLYEINGGNNGLHMYIVMEGENESMSGGFPTFGRTN
ncbi:hypothetical protein MKX03_028763 [Papaver bracteatum]|nr:hypothetical protein MKX03_028763 [Papaver bracteatum]